MAGPSNPTAPGLDFAGVSRPVDDLLDGYVGWLTPSPGEMAFVIGERADMCDAGLVSNSLILHYFRTTISKGVPAPRRLASELNHLLCNVWESTSTATCFYAHYAESTKVLRFINAGHQPPLLIRANPGEIFRLKQGGPSLGLWNTTRFTEGAVQLKTGDRLVAYTSGVMEAWASDDDIAAEAALVSVLHNWRNESAAEIANLIVDNEPETGRAQFDRIAIVASIDSLHPVSNYSCAEQQLAAV
ncbi:MAG: PP2C family protein-serine/threonine phosphatase [Bryobacteraceae bacterium]